MAIVTLTGFEELDRKLRQFADDMQFKITQKSIYAGAQVVRDTAKANVRRIISEGVRWKRWNKDDPAHRHLASGISIRRRRPSGGIITARVGLTKGRAHGVPLERGHVLTRHGKTLKGRVRPYPFMRPAFDNNINKILDAIREKMKTSIDESVR